MRAVVLFCLLSQVLAGPSKPDVTIGINSDSFGKGAALGAVEPHIKWQTSGTFSGLDLDVRYGVEHIVVVGSTRKSII